jgi:hypothetical protein
LIQPWSSSGAIGDDTGTLDVLGHNWTVTPARAKSLTIVHHPGQCFWVIAHLPDRHNPIWPPIRAHHRL